MKARGGKRVIRRVLIANNGIAAVKAIRSIKRWAYENLGSDKAIEFIVMATPEDLKVNAEYIHMADRMVKVPGGTNNHNYANIKLITSIAERYEADAVWAGWGHASENPKLPEALSAKKIIWMGPSPEAMRALGDKIASTIIAQSASVPCVAWSGTGITVHYAKEKGVPTDTYAKACVHSVEQAVEVCREIGFPVMIKASEGGGGKGIRKVEDESKVAFAFRQVEAEVPGSPIFIMKLAFKCRHLEVQLLADEWGNAVALLGRDCSIQRRHQKIIEEGPVVAAPPHIWRQMEQSAVRLAKEVGYVGVGTVEYLYLETGEYFFLELNPRLQVEHPVTELITGVNLPAAQLQVAMGIPLHNITNIRKFFCLPPTPLGKVDFDSCERRKNCGHVIACRITAENPEEGFQPTSGAIEELSFKSTPDVWGYFSVGAHGGVHEFADSQFGHLFAVGDTREIARRSMVVALKELHIRGEIRTTIEYLQKILETDDYKRNKVNTSWLESVMAKGVSSEKPAVHVAVMLGALYRAFQISESRFKDLRSGIETGRILRSHFHKLMEHDISLIYENMKYMFQVRRTGPNLFTFSLNGANYDLEFNALSDGGIHASLGGQAYVVYGFETGLGFRIIINGQTCVFTKEYDPSQLCSNMAGKLMRYVCTNGSHLEKGDPYAEMEVMKMCITLSVPESGLIQFVKPEGSVVALGDLVARLDLDDPSRTKKAILFEGNFGKLEDSELLGRNSSILLNESLEILRRILRGYKAAFVSIDETVRNVFLYLRDNKLPLYEFEEALSVLSGRIPEDLQDALQHICDGFSKDNSTSRFFWETPRPFPMLEIDSCISSHLSKLLEHEKKALISTLAPIRAIMESYRGGPHLHAVRILSSLLQQYLDVETFFCHASREEFAFQELRKLHQGDASKVAEFAIAHAELPARNSLIVTLLNFIENDLAPMLSEFTSVLTSLSSLTGSEYSDVVWKCRQVLLQKQAPSADQRKVAVHTILATARGAKSEDRLSRIQSLIDQSQDVTDILVDVFYSSATHVMVKTAAVEAYIQRTYRMYGVSDLESTFTHGISAKWHYTTSPVAVRKLALPRVESFGDIPENVSRTGWLLIFEDWDRAQQLIPSVFESIQRCIAKEYPKRSDYNHVLHIVIQWIHKLPRDEVFSEYFQKYINSIKDDLFKSRVRRATFVITNGSEDLAYFTYRYNLDYSEDTIVRHIEPTMAAQMELVRLKNYKISFLPTKSRMVHLFRAVPQDESFLKTGLGRSARYDGKRLFARVFLRQLDTTPVFLEDEAGNQEGFPDPEYAFVQALNSMEIALAQDGDSFRHNHIFITSSIEELISVEKVGNGIRKIATKYADTIARLHVTEVEIRLRLKASSDSPIKTTRFVCTNETTYHMNIDIYEEITLDSGKLAFSFVDGADSNQFWDGKTIDSPYPLTSNLELKRHIAENNETLYVYDFPVLFRKSLRRLWHEAGLSSPVDVLNTREFELTETGDLVFTDRPSGNNNIGMVAFELTLKTPEYPMGRIVYVIANDITFRAGSFGPKEDEFFYRVSRLSRERGVPRLYFAANSGARIGLASEIQTKFQVAWIDDDPLKGIDYLYFLPDVIDSVRSSVAVEELNTPRGTRYRITDILGKEYGLGVENLSGSGKIAGETSDAYNDVFTLSYVTGRTVGIGAYLVRLGQRIIQKVGQPILLTGYRALNKLLGREVYTSNSQLGGAGIMFPNGVSHLVVNNDFQGVHECLRWLSYTPATIRDMPVIPRVIDLKDPISRAVECVSKDSLSDPRYFIAGQYTDENVWIPGMFDKGSFVETLPGWAQTVIVGRARLGGIAAGVISVETRTMQRTILADPANPESKEIVLSQAGQVWFADSSFKTAQAIKDMNREGLPLFIFANWRGFSGGMRDMFEEVVKFGSYIVDGLREYKQPIFVYLVPHGELRGGAWVVLDSTINPDFMEMYADPTSRGGILEPAGTVDIKFRKQDLEFTAHRLDGRLIALDKELSVCKTEEEKLAITKKIRNREKELNASLLQVATMFADLHDTPGRMLAVDVIKKIIPAKEARQFFYWRLRRRIEELRFVSVINSLSCPSKFYRVHLCLLVPSFLTY